MQSISKHSLLDGSQTEDVIDFKRGLNCRHSEVIRSSWNKRE